ncbi:MAG: hypothetical protein RLP09_09615 [Sandaracinaceae bacterium]
MLRDFADVRWWAATGTEAAERLWASLKSCEADDKQRHRNILHRARMYGNRHIAGLSSESYHRVNSARRGRLNVVKAVCDTAGNRLIGNRPKPTPQPIKGSNHSIRTRAKNLDRFLQGQFRVSRVRPRMTRLVWDALIAGDGFLKVGEDGEQIVLERTFAGDLSVPPIEARYGEPMTLYQQRYVDREVLLARYPDAEKVIRAAEHASADDEWYHSATDARADQVHVIEGWRLPTRQGAGDGRHVVAVKGGLLHEEEWAHDYFPFVHLAWDAPYLGLWGDSLVDVVAGQQLEINRLVAKVARANDISGHVLIFHNALAKLNKRKIVNEPLAFVPYTDEMPKLVTIEAISPKVAEQIRELKSEAFEMAGLFETGRDAIPAGLETGAAISRWNDLGAIRFRRFSEAFEQAHIDLSQQIIDRARDIAARKDGDFAVPAARDRYTLARIRWSEVDMKADEYVMTVVPSSSLPDDPAGRVAFVETMIRSGMITQQQGAQLLAFPDVDEHLSLEGASRESIEWQIEQMLDEGERQVPQPFQDLRLALTLGQAHLIRAEMEGVPDDRLQLVRDYLTGVHALLQKAQAEQQRLAAEAGQASGGMRAPAPGAPPAQGVAGVNPTAAPAEVTA